MRFNLVQIVSADRVQHGLRGYAEVIESVRWGLEALGHEASVATNSIARESVNILFGFQMVNAAQLNALPEGTVGYNLEQMANLPPAQTRAQFELAAKRLQVWDYNAENLEVWEEFNPVHKPIHVPIGYAPTLSRIPVRQEEPIDVLFYGIPAGHRLQIFHDICAKGMRAVFACGLYGQDRDELIGLAKLVLNLNMYSESRVFEIVRVSYLLANGKAVVSDKYPQTLIEPDMADAVAFAPMEQIADECRRLVQDASARRELEQRGRQIIERRDVREILSRALQAMA